MGGALGKGFLQLCSDRRFHRKVMAAFEGAAGLAVDDYFIEARPGGAPSWDEISETARVLYERGTRVMGWAAHGDGCLGFAGQGTDEVRARLEQTAARRRGDFPDATHFLLFAAGGGVEVRRLSAS